MLRLRNTVNTAGTRANLDEMQAAVRREAAGTEADPFDEAMVAAVLGVAEAMKAEADALAEIEKRICTLARRT